MTGPRSGAALDAELQRQAEAAAQAAGLVVEEVRLTQAGKRRVVRVVVDLPETVVGSVPLDSVAQASQSLSESLDASDVLGAVPYLLEVTSPGVDRPLIERRHYARARTRRVRLALTGGAAAEGRVIEVNDEGVVLLDPTLDPTAPRPEGAERIVGWNEITGGRMVVEFSRAWDTVDVDPADDAGDEFVDEDEEE